MIKEISSKPVILSILLSNLFIMVIKLLAAFLTGSSAILAETVHSFTATFNQVLLWLGVRKGKKEPDSLHPFGFPGNIYFWSFIVAVMLFAAGAVFSIYTGIIKMFRPQPVKDIGFAFIALALAVVVEAAVFYRAFRKINRERQGTKIVEYLRKSKKDELIVVFLEDWAAFISLIMTGVLLYIQYSTGILIFDSIAAVAAGLILLAAAFFVGNETRFLLLGDSASPVLIKKIEKIFTNEESINKIIYLKSLRLGSDNVLLAVKLEFNHRLSSVEISNLIQGIEKEIRGKYPNVGAIYIEPGIAK